MAPRKQRAGCTHNSVIRTREPWNHLENEITVILRNNNFEIYALHLNKLRLVLYLIKYILRLVLLIAEADKVSPIEVKSSGYKAHASLDAFCRKFSARIKNKYLIYTKDMRREEDMLYLPAYMTMFL